MHCVEAMSCCNCSNQLLYVTCLRLGIDPSLGWGPAKRYTVKTINDLVTSCQQGQDAQAAASAPLHRRAAFIKTRC